MSEVLHLRLQLIQLQDLLREAGDDPLIAPQLEQRIAEAEAKLNQLTYKPGVLFPDEPPIPRAAIFLRGTAVFGEESIRAGFAGELLSSYERMYQEQAVHDERVAAQLQGRHRRPRNTPVPELRFTGTPRGSFGFEFSPHSPEHDKNLRLHAQSLTRVAETVVAITNPDHSTFAASVSEVPRGMLGPLKGFLRSLSQNGAEIRFAFEDRQSQVIEYEQIATAVLRLEKEVAVGTEKIPGTFRGLTMDTGKFDFRTQTQQSISGAVAEELSDEDLVRIEKLINQACVATIETTTFSTKVGSDTMKYVLLDAEAADADGS
jgi:hypothetical protein